MRLGARGAEEPSPWQHALELEKRAKCASLPDSLQARQCETCPVSHITLHGSALAGLKLKILQEARTGQKLLPNKCSYLCPADPPAFPALRQEKPRAREGEKG